MVPKQRQLSWYRHRKMLKRTRDDFRLAWKVPPLIDGGRVQHPTLAEQRHVEARGGDWSPRPVLTPHIGENREHRRRRVLSGALRQGERTSIRRRFPTAARHWSKESE